MEMFSLGLLANSGTDFFTLFGKEKGKYIIPSDGVTHAELEKRWNEIEKAEDGLLKKRDATLFMASKKEPNPINLVLRKVTKRFDLERNFSLLVCALVFVALFKALILFSSRFTTQILSIRITRDLRLQYFEHIQSLPMSFYNEHNIGSLTARTVGDAGQIAASLNSCLTNYLQTPFTIITTLSVCFYISWQMSLIVFVGMPLIIIPVVVLTKKVKKVTRQLQQNQESFTSVLLDFLAGIHTVKIFAMELFTLKKYQQQNLHMAKLESKNAKYSLLIRPILHTITTTCLAVVALFGLYILHMPFSQLVVFCGLLHLFYDPVKKFAEENTNIQRGVVAAERMFEVLHLKPEIADIENAKDIMEFKDKIEFKNVSFKYKDEWVLKDVSFTIEKGQTVAIVGPTGAGKSTIVQLIPRLFDVQKGEILIDGKPLKAYTQKSVRDLISFVPQKPFLFYDTVNANITIGKEYSTDAIVDASKKAFAHDFINNLPQKYDTVLAETGKTLSGGQQQRLAIARALVKKTPLLIMDEATSSLDAISENRIKMSIEGLHGEITQVLIAHRLSTVEHADKIIYLEEGEKLAEGTKDELLEICPEFKLMWETFHRIQKKEELSAKI